MSVAVLLPVYHGDLPESFDQALRSVEEQDGFEDEVRIHVGVDGPLPAPLEDVLERHRPRIHRIVRQPMHIGPTANMNALLKGLQDERLVFRMDADDISLPGRFAHQIAFMDAHPDIAILGTTIEEVDTDTGISFIRRFPSDPDSMTRAICTACPVAHPSVCVRPEVYRTLGGYPDTRGQDIALWFEALRHGYRISNLSTPLLQLRVSRTFLERRSSLVRALPEFRIYMRGIWHLHGVTWRYVLPVSRLLLRLSGPRVSGWIYRTQFRNWLTSLRTKR